MTTITVTHEDNEIDEFAFGADDRVVSIGRRSTNDVCIPNLSVSGVHARITIDGDTVSIEDNNSTNGTYVNGRLISRQLLNKDDEIVIGKTRVVVQLKNNGYAAARSARPTAHAELPALSAVSDYKEDEDLLDADDSFVSDTKRTGSERSDKIDDRRMSLSEKAKLALNGPSRSDGTGPHTALNGVAKNSVGTVSAAPSTSNRAFAHDDDDVAVAPRITDSRSRMQAVVEKQPAANSIEPHPLDGLDDQLDNQLNDSALESESASEPVSELDQSDSEIAPTSSVRKPTGAVIEIQNGAKSGQVLPIDKPVTTLGRPGIQIAAIMRKPDGYFLMHIESDDCVEMPTLNRDSIGDDPVMLHSGDRLNVAGIDVEFMLS